MNNQSKINVLLLFLLLVLLSINIIAENRTWSSGTAYLLPPGRWELGLFQSLRYGISETKEISFHPLFMFVIPNGKLKIAHQDLGKFQFASEHSLNYPTILLDLISRKGTGGIISPEFKIPPMISSTNSVLLSKPLGDNSSVTAKLGLMIAVKFGDLDKRTTIDLPIVFPRLNVFYNNYGFKYGGDLRGKIWKNLNYQVDVDLFHFPGADEKLAMEHKGLLLWNKSQRFQMCLGYELTYGEYPFGTQWHLLLPLIDLQWAWAKQ